MDLNAYYNKQDNIDLIEIIENNADYTEECVLVVKDVLESRNLSIETIKPISLIVIKKKIQIIFDDYFLSSKEIIPHKSPFLNKKEMRDLYISELEIFMNRKGEIDVFWSYAIGGL